MLKYAKIINQESKQCFVGTGTNEKYYQSIGMQLLDVEQAYNNNWYLTGYAPQKPDEQQQEEVRYVRNQYLQDTDKYMLSDFPIDYVLKDKYKYYRQYLRNYTEQENWWEQNPKTFDEWIK